MKKRIGAIFITIISIFLIGNLLSCGNDNELNETEGVSASFEYAKVSGTVGYITESNFDSNSDDENLSKSNLMEEPVFENDELCYMVIDLTITTTADNDGGQNLDILTEISNRAVIRPNIERTPTAKIDQKVSNGAYTLYTTYSVLPKVGDEKKVFMIIELYPVSSGETDISLLIDKQELYSTETATNNTDLYYSINDDGASYTVTGVKNSSATSVTIPETLRDGLTVTNIGTSAFSDRSSLTSITIPNSVTSIGTFAFSGCSSLTSITIPDSVTSIERGTFSNCDSLWKINLGNSVTSIGEYAFRNCDSIMSITLPDSVTSIGSNAFYECRNLTSITIPNSVMSIGRDAFFLCDDLRSIKYTGTVEEWTAIQKYAYWDQSAGNYTITYNYSE